MSSRRTVTALLVTAVLAVISTSIGLDAQPAAAASPPPSLLVAPDDGGIVRAGKGLGVTVTVTNTGSAQLPEGRLTFSLDDAPVAGTTTLLSSIANPPEALQGKLARAKADVPALAGGATERVRTTLDTKDLKLLSSASGASRLYVQYQPSTGVRKIAVSSVVKMASGSKASVGLGIVIPVLAPAGTTGVVDIATQQELTGPEGAWTHALRAAEAFPAATVALDPAVIASIRLAGDAAPPEAAGFLDALGRLPNETVRLPYADADVTLERAAGLATPLEPSSFSAHTITQSAPSDADGPTPAPTRTTGDVATSAADLTDWNWSEQTVDWPVPHTAGSGDVAALGARGAAILLPSDDIGDTPARRTAGPLAAAGSTKVLVADTTVSALLATAAGDGRSSGAALATLTGVLATAAVTGETTALLATPGRSADPARLDQVLSTLGGRSWVRGRSLEQLATGAATRVSVRARSVPATRTATAKSLVAGEHDVQELGRAITTGAETITAPRRLALLGMLSASWHDDPGWQAAADVTEQSFRNVVDQVHLVRGAESNAIGTDGKLSVTVANELPVPVTVVVRASVNNGRLQFPDDSAAVTVPAEANGVARLAYRSITNGKAQVSLRLETKAGTTIDTGDRQFTVSAGFDTIIAVVLLTALGLLLALGVYRNVKRRRQPRPAAA